MSKRGSGGDAFADDMAEYLRLYVEETEEQLDALVETLLTLENDSADAAAIREAFRLIHSIKGSAALLGLDAITALTHHLESHFERLRSGQRRLDAPTMQVALECIDFLRDSNRQLRAGTAPGGAGALLDAVRGLEAAAPAESAPEPPATPPTTTSATVPTDMPATTPSGGDAAAASRDPSRVIRNWRVTVRLRAGLPLAEMKAELVLTRLSALGTLVDVQPPRDRLLAIDRVVHVEAIIASDAPADRIDQAAHAEGVERVAVEEVAADARARPEAAAGREESGPEPPPAARVPDSSTTAAAPGQPHPDAAAPAETVRVDVQRLDVLLDLTGELIVCRARLAQLAAEMAPALRKPVAAGRLATVAESVRDVLADPNAADGLASLAQPLELLDDQVRRAEDVRLAFEELSAAIDQLTRVSSGLQRGVLETRMVPVGPLFNRFRRSVRDVARELGKQVRLEIAGERTELDKRMIDELGDPLNHLVRNCIDHGIEPADVRQRAGKPAEATVRLAAAHRGSNVFITVEDDGGGIDTAAVRRTAVARGLVSAEAAAGLTDREAIDLIFEPGFSTAAVVSGISGRGVGMDIVRTRIAGLNGRIEIDSVPGRGTRFTIRLPLTLTITRCMLFRLPQGVLAVPIEHVREITALEERDRVAVQGREVCDVRGEFLPLVRIEELLRWPRAPAARAAADNVAILQADHRAFGLMVEAPLGGQDLVIKPLDEHFIHVRGLGGASILGDGSVCLLLDVAACGELVRRGPTTGTPPLSLGGAA